jgi:hypothetical protein
LGSGRFIQSLKYPKLFTPYAFHEISLTKTYF